MVKSEKDMALLTFVHVFKIPVIEMKHMMPKQFATVFDFGLVNWNIQIAESGGIPAFIRNIIEEGEEGNREPSYQITLHPSGARERHPPVQKIEFKLRILDSQGNDKLAPCSYIHPGGFPSRSVLNSGYCTPLNHEIRRLIAMVAGHRILEHLEFEVQTTIEFDVEEFLDVQYLNRLIGVPMPIQLNFRFNLLTNESTHNFTLTTTTGLKFPCNKEALYVCSPYFRRTLTSSSTNLQMDVEYLEAIQVVITWLFSESYHPPPQMTPELADEILKLTERLVPRGVNQRHLMGSVERHCFEELIRNYEDLKYVKHLMLVAHNNRLGSLLEACHATLISFHYQDFLRSMQANPDPAFTHQGQTFRSSALARLNENYLRSLFVKRFTRKSQPTVVA